MMSAQTARQLQTRISRKYNTRIHTMMMPKPTGAALRARNELCSVMVDKYGLTPSRAVKYVGGEPYDIQLAVDRHNARKKLEGFQRNKLWAGQAHDAKAPAIKHMPFVGSCYREVVRRVAKKHGVTKSDLEGKSRAQKVAHARQELYARLREGENPMSYPNIGRRLDRDHSTIMHGEKQYWKRQAELEAA